MGRPKRCASRKKPYISYYTTPVTTTTLEPIDYSSYIVIPESGIACPSTTTTTTTTTTAEPIDGCYWYTISGSNYIIKAIDCEDQTEKIYFRCGQSITDICVSGVAPTLLASFDNNVTITKNGECIL